MSIALDAPSRSPVPRLASPRALPPIVPVDAAPTSPLGLLLDSAGLMAGLGLYHDSRTVLIAALEVTLRARGPIPADTRGSAYSTPIDYAGRLRLAELIDKRLAGTIVNLCLEDTPYDVAFVARLANAVRETIGTLRTKGGVS